MNYLMNHLMSHLNLKNTLLGLVLMIGFTQAQLAIAWGWDNCEYSRDINKSVSLQSLGQLAVSAGAGKLKIVGDTAQKKIQIKAKLCASGQDFLDEMNVATEHGSDRLSIETVFPKKRLWRDEESASIDLELIVPAHLLLDVQDSSGEASVSGVASLSMVDSSGSLNISDIGGDLKVVDSSGELVIRNIRGNVSIRDSSGAIIASKVTGNLVVEVDSSGAIEAADIGKNVLVKVDSSGGIDVRDVAGDFTVLKDSSGGITHKRVLGKVRI